MHFTVQSGKKLKLEFATPQTRIFYSSPFDLFNYSDIHFIQSLSKRFENSFLIIGLEDPQDQCLMTLQEREESLRRIPEINQILSPCPEIDKDFLQTYEINYLFTTPENSGKFSGLDLGESLIVVDPPLKLHKNELLGRILANKNRFLAKCLDNGYSRRQLGASLLNELVCKLQKFVDLTKWGDYRERVLRKFRMRGRKFYKKISDRLAEIESAVEETLISHFEE